VVAHHKGALVDETFLQVMQVVAPSRQTSVSAPSTKSDNADCTKSFSCELTQSSAQNHQINRNIMGVSGQAVAQEFSTA
jgi:hypothetical protein